jgi:hypothetical protein
MRPVFLDWENIFKTILEHVFFYILTGFFLKSAFLSKNLRIALLRGEIFSSSEYMNILQGQNAPEKSEN